MREYDVIVVGGGPAGSMAAFAAADRGLDVLLVERDLAIGVPVRCAEGVDDKGLRQFFTPDPGWISATVTGYTLVAPDGSRVDMAPEGFHGYILERTIFDRMVAEHAAAAGADIHVGAEATGLGPFENGRRTVFLNERGRRWEATAKVVVAADGVESRTARWAGLKTAVPLRDMESAVQYLVTGVDIDQARMTLWFTSEYAPGGYVWIFPKGPGKANIGLGLSGDHAGERSPESCLKRFLADQYPKATAVVHTSGGIPCTGGIDDLVADGLMVVGDAAHMANPITGGGLINALIAGQLAGETAAEALAKGPATVKALNPYVKHASDRIVAMNRRFHKLKDGVFTLTDEQLNKLARDMNGLPLEKRTPVRVLRSALAKHPELILLLANVAF